jgi:predicted DCC family thiol-disulfide oxidoreductase YuxK
MNLVIYDGACIFCNRFILFLVRIDVRNRLKFCELQSQTGMEFLRKHQLPESNFETIYFISDGKLSDKSIAVLRIFQSVGGFWALASVFYLVPVSIRNRVYDIVSEYRHRLFTAKSRCKLPAQHILKKLGDNMV